MAIAAGALQMGQRCAAGSAGRCSFRQHSSQTQRWPHGTTTSSAAEGTSARQTQHSFS
jgi:hypothetical protein